MAEAAIARPSSTVVLVRDADDRPEVLMVKRHARSSFGAAFAFPGGVLEADDSLVHDRCMGITADEANTLLETDDALDYYSSAVRELFEEAGVLLADYDELPLPVEEARRMLNDNTASWKQFLEDGNMRLRCADLLYFSFWITPETIPKRYSTRFFLAELPEGQEAMHCGGELTDSVWMTANDVLAASRTGKMTVHFPTMTTLKSLAGFESVAEMQSWCRSRQQDGVPCIHPRIVGGRPVLR